MATKYASIVLEYRTDGGKWWYALSGFQTRALSGGGCDTPQEALEAALNAALLGTMPE